MRNEDYNAKDSFFMKTRNRIEKKISRAYKPYRNPLFFFFFFVSYFVSISFFSPHRGFFSKPQKPNPSIVSLSSPPPSSLIPPPPPPKKKFLFFYFFFLSKTKVVIVVPQHIKLSFQYTSQGKKNIKIPLPFLPTTTTAFL